MIDTAVVLLRDLLNEHLNALSVDAGDATEDLVLLIDGDKQDPELFRLNAVSALLVNVEADNSLPPADPFRRARPDGTQIAVAPAIRINLSVLFVARFKQYDRGLARLSEIIKYFQNHRVLDRNNTPTLGGGIEKLMIELVTLPLAEQNDLWGALRTTYHPSVLYRVRMVTFEEPDTEPGPEITEILTSVAQ